MKLKTQKWRSSTSQYCDISIKHRVTARDFIEVAAHSLSSLRTEPYRPTKAALMQEVREHKRLYGVEFDTGRISQDAKELARLYGDAKEIVRGVFPEILATEAR